ncbi:reverse transcriptase domain-containing protein, partial [Tanacetum coccineum]
ELGHERKFITEIVARRANGCIVSITEPDYKNLNKNDIEDMYLLIMNNKVPDYANTGLLWSLSVFIRSSVIWERVHDFQLGIESYQQKINLTAPTITFPGIKEYDVFSIFHEPVHGIIYTNSKKEKRVMRPSKIQKFCDATLRRTLEGLKSYYNDVKYGYVQKELTNDEVEFLKLFEEEIEVRLNYRDQMRRWEMNLLMNKKKLLELAKIPLNENCSAMLLKRLPEKLGDPGKFLIPCDFPGMDVCHALADLGASINLMPLSFWKKLSLPELTPTRMTLELADRSITHPKGLAEDVYVKVGKFHFPTDFVVVDFEADPRVPLILGRSFLRIGLALIDVYGEEITLQVDNEAVTFNLDQTTRYSYTNDKSVNRIDIIDAVCEEYALELLGFSNSLGGNPTPTAEPLTSEFILEEIEAYLKDDRFTEK